MKLPEALRLADQMELPDLRGTFLERDVSEWGGEKPPCCAIGGANIASRYAIISMDDARQGVLSYESEDKASDTFQWIHYYGFDGAGDPWCFYCPVLCGYDADDVIDGVIHLYDFHKWTRTSIADWLDNQDLDYYLKEVVE